MSKIRYGNMQEALELIDKAITLQVEINRNKKEGQKVYHFLKDEFLARIYEEKG